MAGARPVSGNPQTRLHQPGEGPWAAIAGPPPSSRRRRCSSSSVTRDRLGCRTARQANPNLSVTDL